MSIRRYGDSPFKSLFESGNDQALLNLTGLDHSTFNELLALFGPQYKGYMFDSHTKMGKIRPKKLSRYGEPRGRRRKMDATGCLGDEWWISFRSLRQSSQFALVSFYLNHPGSRQYKLKPARGVGLIHFLYRN